MSMLACSRIALALNLTPVPAIDTSDTESAWAKRRPKSRNRKRAWTESESIAAERLTCRLRAAHSECPFSHRILDKGARKLSQHTVGTGSRELLHCSESVDLSPSERIEDL
jgi:hypothetical protein